ncbi:hypothetical protein SNE40_017038 [Patella caerulea]|uniref:CCHC-type domain-containing protein n=1 Tax=Patella caerulea TaxID=87958 RepID=A0AAN8PKR2_PATCE
MEQEIKNRVSEFAEQLQAQQSQNFRKLQNQLLTNLNTDAQIPSQLLSKNFQDIKLELRAQNILSQIKSFSGEGYKRFSEWLKELEQARMLISADNKRMIALALQTSTAMAGEFITRYVREHPGSTWDRLKEVLKNRFGDYTDAQCALQKLKKLKQGQGETEQCFGDRIKSLSEEAYSYEHLKISIVQSILVDIFIDGVRDDRTVNKLIRDTPTTLDVALEKAISDQLTPRAFQLRRRVFEEPMEIDQLSSLQRTNKELRDKTDKLSENFERLLLLNERIMQTPSTQDRKQFNTPASPVQSNFKWTEDGKPICCRCSRAGHIGRNCRQNSSGRQQTFPRNTHNQYSNSRSGFSGRNRSGN